MQAPGSCVRGKNVVKAVLVSYCYCRRLPSGSQVVKNPPAKQEMGVPFLGREDPLEEVMATQSSIRVWKIPWTLEPGGL